MADSKRIFIVSDIQQKPAKIFLNEEMKLGKGFIRLGHDVRYFSYFDVLRGFSPVKSRKLGAFFYKKKVDDLLASILKNYKPDIVYASFPRVFDAMTVEKMREAAPQAVFVAFDCDPWPELHPKRVDTAKKFDILLATNEGRFLQTYRDVGIPNCFFMPNTCDPDVEHNYQVGREWQSDIIWTGSIQHDIKRYPAENMRYELVSRLVEMPNCAVYGCCGRRQIGGFDYLYAISGARIGLSINADNNVRLYHSNRLTHYLSCGTFVLAKRVPDTDLLFRDGVHLKYFDSKDEFFELADWYLKHEDERKKIADAGMNWTHQQYNCVKIAGFVLDLVEKGGYCAPWNQT